MQTQSEGSHLLVSTKPSVLLTPSFRFGISDLGRSLCLLWLLYTSFSFLYRGFKSLEVLQLDLGVRQGFLSIRDLCCVTSFISLSLAVARSFVAALVTSSASTFSPRPRRSLSRLFSS